LTFEPETDREICSCANDTCCRGWPQKDHGIAEAMKSFRKHSKKKDKRRKVPMDVLQDAAVQTEENIKMEVDSIQEADADNAVSLHPDTIPKLTKTESCCSSKSQGGESDIRCDMSSDSINSLNNSDITPSDQRSNNENGSSVKESDGDEMSKKSDSSSDKHLASSESDSESKTKLSVEFFDNMFTSLYMCFPHSHKNTVPWLADLNFDKDMEMKYHMVTGDQESVLERDRQQLAMLGEPDLVGDQLAALMEECQDSNSNLDISSMMLSSEQSLELQEKEVAISE